MHCLNISARLFRSCRVYSAGAETRTDWHRCFLQKPAGEHQSEQVGIRMKDDEKGWKIGFDKDKSSLTSGSSDAAYSCIFCILRRCLRQTSTVQARLQLQTQHCLRKLRCLAIRSSTMFDHENHQAIIRHQAFSSSAISGSTNTASNALWRLPSSAAEASSSASLNFSRLSSKSVCN